jgi:hypothetical protein
MIGYDKGENGEWVINEKQAEVVRYIFNRYIYGKSAHKIANELNEIGYKTVNGNMWYADGVLDVLRNEKYVGDLEMQKTVTKDFLTHCSIVNRGEAPKYYLENHHTPIIDHDTWDKVQALLYEKSRKKPSIKEKHTKPSSSPFTNLTCGRTLENGETCGSKFFRQTYSGVASGYTDERSLEATGGFKAVFLEKYTYSYPVWRCRRKLDKENQPCPSELLHECAIKQSFMEMLYRLKQDYEENGDSSKICQLFKEAYDQTYISLRDNSVTIQRMEILDEQIKKVNEDFQKAIVKTRETIGEEEEAYIEIARNLRQQLIELKSRRESLNEEQGVLSIMKQKFDFFIKCLKELPEVEEHELLHFDRSIYCVFITGGVIDGNTIEYTTNFGVKLTSHGNLRTLKSFVGYHKKNEDGTIELLDEPYKVCGTKIQYRRYRRKKRKKRVSGGEIKHNKI